MSDLVVLVADKDMEQAIRQLLLRPQSFGIAPPNHEVYVHPGRDSGCRVVGHDLLRPFASQYRFAMMMFDREGSGGEALAREPLEREAERTLASNGWKDRCIALVFDPELETWVWTDSPELDRVTGWRDQTPVRDWLTSQGFEVGAHGKPTRPKEALRAVLRHTRKQPSAALFAELGAKVGVSRCTDPTFLKLKATLRGWFPPR